MVDGIVWTKTSKKGTCTARLQPFQNPWFQRWPTNTSATSRSSPRCSAIAFREGIAGNQTDALQLLGRSASKALLSFVERKEQEPRSCIYPQQGIKELPPPSGHTLLLCQETMSTTVKPSRPLRDLLPQDSTLADEIEDHCFCLVHRQPQAASHTALLQSQASQESAWAVEL